MPQLDVYLNDTCVGQLLQGGEGQFSFSCRGAFMQSAEATPLLRHLPLQPQGDRRPCQQS